MAGWLLNNRGALLINQSTEGVSADLDRPIKVGHARLDLPLTEPVHNDSHWILYLRLRFKIPEIESYSTDHRSTARVHSSEGLCHVLIPAIGFAIDGKRFFTYPQPTNRPNRASAAASLTDAWRTSPPPS
jgi:hypothetical protein